jgi:hypothetical protein
MGRGVTAFACAVLLLLGHGCATTSNQACTDCVSSSANSVEIRRGRPNRILDGTGWVLGVPSKIALWDRRADNHHISAQTEARVVDYLEGHDLSDVMVRVNQYDPFGEWKRLATNDQIAAGWRFTGGTIETLKYTMLPGRLFGQDWYNPFTNSLHMYSDIPPLALAEAAYAKDVQQRQHPGGYATGQILPILNMWHHTIATQEVLRHLDSHGTDDERAEAYRILYPSYGGNWGASIGSFLPFGHAFSRLAGAMVGHAANGLRKASHDM